MMPKLKSINIFDIVLFVTLIVLIFPFIFLHFFSFPCGDDVMFGSGLKNPNFQWKLNGGRLTAYYLMHYSPVMNLTYFRIAPLIGIFLLLLTLYKILSYKIKNLSILSKINICLAFQLSLYLLMPATSSQFYWYTGFVVYYIPFIFIFTFLLFTFNYTDKNLKFYSTILLLSLLNIILSFWHEIYAGLLLMLSATYLFLNVIRGKKFHVTNFIAASQIIVGLINVFFVLNAPGNVSRLSRSKGSSTELSIETGVNISSNLWDIGWHSFLEVWITNYIFLALLLILLVAYSGYFQISDKNMKWYEHLIHLFLLLTITLFTFLPAVVANKGIGWKRIYNPNCMVFVSFVFFYILWKGKYLFKKYDLKSVKYFFLSKYLSLIIFLLCVYFSPNSVKLAYKDLTGGKAHKYKIEMDERIELLTYDVPSVKLKKTSFRPRTIFQEEMLNARPYINGYKRYYKKETIEVVK